MSFCRAADGQSCPPPCEPPPVRTDRARPASSPVRRRNRDVVLPLNVSLEELYSGATRHVSLNLAEIRRAGHNLLEDKFQIQIPRGAPDGHRVVFRGKARPSEPDARAEPGDLCFVLQEVRHSIWRRKGMDLYIERTITLLEALTGYALDIEHLDGTRLIVNSKPGEIVRPKSILLNDEADWERFDAIDAFPGQDAAAMKTDDLEACKEFCQQKGLSGFTYWEDTAYFRSQDRTALLAARKASRGSTLFVCPDPAKSAVMRLQRAIRGAGMHSLEDPNLRGNLFVLLRVLLPTGVDEDSAQLLREVLPSVAPGALEELSATGEELE
ncbi:unnamed protein product, partial [Polarella glacialis]